MGRKGDRVSPVIGLAALVTTSASAACGSARVNLIVEEFVERAYQRIVDGVVRVLQLIFENRWWTPAGVINNSASSQSIKSYFTLQQLVQTQLESTS